MVATLASHPLTTNSPSAFRPAASRANNSSLMVAALLANSTKINTNNNNSSSNNSAESDAEMEEERPLVIEEGEDAGHRGETLDLSKKGSGNSKKKGGKKQPQLVMTTPTFVPSLQPGQISHINQLGGVVTAPALSKVASAGGQSAEGELSLRKSK